jgi:hypothetical protein
LTTSSEILISPNTEAKDYSIYIQGAGNANFSIVKYPSWLNFQNLSGQFSNDAAIINCSASAQSNFSEISIYKSFIVLNIEGSGNVIVPVSYINEGNPVAEAVQSLVLKYNSVSNNGKASLVVKNTGNGILIWSIVEKSNWFSIPDGLINHTFMLPQNGEYVIDLSCNIESLISTDLQGRIVIATNDKNNSSPVVTIYCNPGNRSLSCSTNHLDFGRTEVIQSFNISNQGDGLLTWKIESCPEWLNVSETSGMLYPYSSKTLVFTCNRDLLPNELQTQTIDLITNDPNNPSYKITVTVDNTLPEDPNPENPDPEDPESF